MALIKVNPTRAIDTESDISYVNNGNYLDALNVRSVSEGGQASIAKENIIGNEYAFLLPEIEPRNKRIRIYFSEDGTTSKSYVLQSLDPNGNVVFQTSTFSNTPTDVSLTMTQARASISAAATATGNSVAFPSITVTSPQREGYFDVEINTIPYWDYTINSNLGTNAISITTVIEAYDESLRGKCEAIASNDVMGSTFIWATIAGDKRVIVNQNPISVLANSPSLEIIITYAFPHNILAGELVDCYGFGGVPQANGRWIVAVPTPTQLVLRGSDIGSGIYTTGGTVVTKVSNFLHIGRLKIEQNFATTANSPQDFVSYQPIISTTQWYGSAFKQPQTYGEKEGSLYSLYWVDGVDFNRAFYVNESQIEVPNGVFLFANSQGRYSYDSLSQETELILRQSGLNLSFEQQLQTGGNIPSGNVRYTIRCLTDNLNATEWSELTNPINVYLADTNGNPLLLQGDPSGTVTSKINELKVTGLITGLFSFIELGVVYYNGNSVTGFIVKRQSITSNEMTLQHTGYEPDTQELDIGTINAKQATYISASSIDVLDNQMILSDLKTQQIIDFSAFFKTFRHSLERKEIDPIRGATYGNYNANEYFLPINVNNNIGYMANESYRFGARVKLRGSGWTNTAFWIDDIRIDVNTINTANPFGDNRRDIPLGDYNITVENMVTSPAARVYVNYVDFHGFDTGFLVDGVPIYRLIEEIEIVRVEMTEALQEVLASGIAVRAVRGQQVFSYAGATDTFENPIAPAPTNNEYIEYMLASGYQGAPSNATIFPLLIPDTHEYLAFYAPDLIYTGGTITHSDIDVLINMGMPNVDLTTLFGTAAPAAAVRQSSYREYSGQMNSFVNQRWAIKDAQFVTSGNNRFVESLTTYGYYSKIINWATSSPVGAKELRAADSLVIQIELNGGNLLPSIPAPSSPTDPFDNGCRYVQYFRPKIGKFGDINNSKYISTNTRVKINNTRQVAPSGFVTVFGGDAMIQKTHFKHRYPLTNAPVGYSVLGLGGGISFYTQNRINSQMRSKDAIGGTSIFPEINPVQWLEKYFSNVDPIYYDNGYTPKNGVTTVVGYDSTLPSSNVFEARIAYSQKKPNGSLIDNYRVFLPLDFRDLDMTNGRIVHIAVGNGELYTWQQRAFIRQFFNSTSVLQTVQGAEVILGDGKALSRNGVSITKIGTTHKWSVIKGRSRGGGDVFAWWNTELGYVCRFGQDGTNPISETKNMAAFFNNNTNWAKWYFSPAAGIGIHGVYEERFRDYIWVVKAWNKLVTSWVVNSQFNKGDLVIENSNRDTFELVDDLWESLVDTNLTQPSPTNPLWRRLPKDNAFYNLYTIAYNEASDGFSTKYTFKPSIFIKNGKDLFSPTPNQNRNKVYRHNKGEYLVWYKDGNVEQSESGYVEAVMNYDPNVIKSMLALQFTTDNIPNFVELETKLHKSYLEGSDFEIAEGLYFAAIKNDSTISVDNPLGSNEEDTSRLHGQYLKVKLYFQPRAYQRLFNFIVKYIDNSRNYKT